MHLAFGRLATEDEAVGSFLARLGLSELGPAFAAHDINLDTMEILTDDDLQDMGPRLLSIPRFLVEKSIAPTLGYAPPNHDVQLNVPSRAGVSKSTARKVILKAASCPRDHWPHNRSSPASATSRGNLHGDSLAQPGPEGDQDLNPREGDVDDRATGREQDVSAAHDGGDVCLTHQGDDCKASARADVASWMKTHVLCAGGECPVIEAEKSSADEEQGHEDRTDEVPVLLYLYNLTGSCFLQHIASRWLCGKEQFRLMRMACLQEYGSRYIGLRDTIMSLDGQARLLVAKTVFRYCHLCARLSAGRRGAGAGAGA